MNNLFYQLKIAFRNLRNNRLCTGINIGGLAISIAATVLIMLWVYDEWNFDKSYKDNDRIYLAVNHGIEDGRDYYIEYLPAPLAQVIQANIPSVENASAFGYDGNMAYLSYGDKKCFGVYTDFALSDTTFFGVFDMQFIEGNASTAFRSPVSIILCHDWAQQLFGKESAIGKLLKANNGKEYEVTAVVKPRENSSFNFKTLTAFERNEDEVKWYYWTSRIFLKIHPDTDLASVGTMITEVHQNSSSIFRDEYPYLLQAVSKTHLYASDGSETGMKNVRLFSLIALALVVIACINYVNLVTARMNKRDKEITLRKLLGAKKSWIFGQAMGESLLLFFIAFIVAQLLLFVSMPFYSSLTGKHFSFELVGSIALLLSFVILLIVTLLAGVYPAIRMASFRPVGLSRSQAATRNNPFALRKLLVVLQFTCSAVLILITIAMSLQQRFMRTKDSGYQRENVFTIDVLTNKNSGNYYHAFKQELEQQPEIIGVTASEQNMMNVNRSAKIVWEGKPDDLNINMTFMGIDRDFLEVMGITLTEGGFTGTAADSGVFLINETAVKQMGLTDPLNTSITNLRGGGRIAGVVEDFHFRHMNKTIGPMVMFIPRSYWTYYVKVAPGKTNEALTIAEHVWKKYEHNFPFKYTFMDETFARIYENDIRASRLFNVFAVIAILISCLGLFGLVTYTAETKTKEIGIRKVLGASVSTIVELLTKDFFILVVVAMFIAFPLAYYFMDKMLQDYAYRINISWWMFAAAAIITVVLTLLTVGWQAIRAATANPVKAIKSE